MKLLLSALEPSANLHLEPILGTLDSYKPYGIFDERFGVPLVPSRAFSVMGIIDVLPKIRLAKKVIKEMVKLSFSVDKVILVDSPAFNLPLAKAIKKANPNANIIYYILPQVWAWKKKRVAKIERYCDVLASILPFEQRFYNRAIYVGNPLLDEICEYKERYTPTGSVAFLPGSRKSEIQKLLPIYKQVAKETHKNNILVIPPHFSDQEIDTIYGDISAFEISRDTHASFSKSEFAFVCSGTATLEAALIGVPMVLAYKAKALDYYIGRTFVKLPFVGLANIILGFEGLEPLHAEFLQQDVNCENLLREYRQMDREKFVTGALKLRKILGKGSKDAMLDLILDCSLDIISIKQ